MNEKIVFRRLDACCQMKSGAAFLSFTLLILINLWLVAIDSTEWFGPSVSTVVVGRRQLGWDFMNVVTRGLAEHPYCKS